MWPATKQVLFALKECQKKVFKLKIQILASTISVHMVCGTHKNTIYAQQKNYQQGILKSKM